jgi:hypothetical protein
MNLMPYKRFEIQTRMTLPEAVTALSRFVQTNRGFKGWLFSKEDFVGRINSDGFAIRRKIGYANSFLPICRGKFEQTPEGTRVGVIMTPSVFVILFCCLFAAFRFSATPRADSGTDSLFAVALLLVFYAVLLTAFHFEAAKAEKFLRETLYP